MDIKVIKNRSDYDLALAEVERLAESDPPPGSAEGERLELLAVLVERYEEQKFPIEAPTPIDAIRFRMEAQGLTPRDLEPFIGSRSKVSEVLAGKVPLSLRMIRALSSGMRIPIELLVGRDDIPSPGEPPRLPEKEIIRRGWLRGRADTDTALLDVLTTDAGGRGPLEAFLRRSYHVRGSAGFDRGSQVAWALRVLGLSRAVRLGRPFVPGVLDSTFFSHLMGLSRRAEGPVLARRALQEIGIPVVFLRHLPRTRLDGAALQTDDRKPVIGLTLRLDRLDNFWFTLVHELIHIREHLGVLGAVYMDDIEVRGGDEIEDEADALTHEVFVSRSKWERSRARQERTPAAVMALADEVGVHPAIVAGLVRHDAGNYRILTQLVGQGEVRRLFPEWSE